MASSPGQRTLIPHEHGAWGQLLLPLVCGLALGRLTAAALLLAAAVVLFFVAHEPLLVVLGQRGARVRAEHGPRARRWLGVLLAAAGAAGVAGLALAPAAARAAVLVPVALAGAVAWLVWRKREKTVLGEVTIAAALASAAAAVALAGAAGPAGLAAAAAALAASGFPAALPVAAAPTLLISLAVCLGRVTPRRLRPLGWALVGSSMVTLAVLVAGLR